MVLSGILSHSKLLVAVLFIGAVVVGVIPFEILFSVTSLFAVVLLLAVVAASYIGTTIALRGFFEREYREQRRDEHR